MAAPADEPVRTLVLWCPDWPVVVHGLPADVPAAVVVANRVLACSGPARAQGVQAGQRRREAQGRSPTLEVLDRDELLEARAFEPLVAAVADFTPRLELTRPGSCALITRGPSRYFGGDQALARRVHGAVVEVLGEGGTARVGVADGRFAASLAARQPDARGGTFVVPPGHTPTFLSPLPVSTLGRPELADVLVRLGITTLGGFAALSPDDVVGRFGAEGRRAHRLARGLDEHPPDTRVPMPDLTVTAEIDPPAARVDQVAFVGKSLADELHARLDARGMACTRVAVEAETEHAEHLVRLWRHEGALRAGATADRVRWQLEGWLCGSAGVRPTAGITRLTLVPDEITAASGRQLGFWGGQTDSAERAARALTRVEGLLGPDAVGVPEWRGGRSPRDQVVLVPAAAVDLAAPRPAADPSWVEAPWPGKLPAPAPATVYDEPPSAEVVDVTGTPVAVSGRGEASSAPAQLSVAGGRWLQVMSWAGPWPVDERWWDRRSRRRRARLQLLTAEGQAHLVAVEGGRWFLEATYD